MQMKYTWLLEEQYDDENPGHFTLKRPCNFHISIKLYDLLQKIE